MNVAQTLRSAAVIACACTAMVGAQDGPELESQSVDLVNQIQAATSYTSTAYADIYRAVGNKEMAAKLTAISTELAGKKSVSNKDSLKLQIDAVNTAGAGLDKVDLMTTKLNDSAKSALSSSMLNMGVASIYDGLATKSASDLLAKGNESLKALSGFAALKQAPPIKRSIANSNWVLNSTPSQVKQLTAAMNKVSEYSKAKGIPLPTQEAIDEKAKGLKKE